MKELLEEMAFLLEGGNFAYPTALLTKIKAALAQEQEPVDFTSLLREAEEIVQSKPTWKRFIDGTPLSNDIAVWMAVFAQDVARRTWVGLTFAEICEAEVVATDGFSNFSEPKFARAIEAKLKEKNT